MVVENIVWNGHKYRRYPDKKDKAWGRYFHRSGGHTTYLLHREVWALHNGKIKKGFHVHHIDGNPANNEITNLECISAKKHSTHHAGDIAKNPKRHADLKIHLSKIRPLTKEWHGSKEGLAWHAKHAKKIATSIKNKRYKCEVCLKSYWSKRLYGNRFCSANCRSASRRASGIDNETRKCKNCSVMFSVNKYSKQQCCSRSCANGN